MPNHKSEDYKLSAVQAINAAACNVENRTAGTFHFIEFKTSG
jgi:hypothetical protein